MRLHLNSLAGALALTLATTAAAQAQKATPAPARQACNPVDPAKHRAAEHHNAG